MEGVIAMGLKSLTQNKKETFATQNVLGSINDSAISGINKLQEENLFYKLKNNDTTVSSIDRISSILFIIFWVILGVYCGYLSWKCNDLIGWTNVHKSVFAFGAFMFPFYYIIMYFIGKYDLILYIQKRR